MLYDITIPAFIKGLRNLLNILEKGAGFADSKKIQMDVLLNARLAPDQFHLIKQVQIVTDTAKLCAARLTGAQAPTHDDGEKSLSEVQARIHSVISYLETFSKDQFKDASAKHITQPRWEGKYLTGEEYVLHHALPNFYFHITTAYSILRHNGVDVGKKDFLGAMPYKQ